jgi:GAF domain
MDYAEHAIVRDETLDCTHYPLEHDFPLDEYRLRVTRDGACGTGRPGHHVGAGGMVVHRTRRAPQLARPGAIAIDWYILTSTEAGTFVEEGPPGPLFTHAVEERMRRFLSGLVRSRGSAERPCHHGGSMSYQTILEDLRRVTNASRTTLRLEQPGGDFPVVAEALAAGMRSIRGDSGIAVRDSATFTFLDRERRLLIVNDCRVSDPPTPHQLMEFYGVRAEMLAPLIDGERIVGIVSVHLAGETREWSGTEIHELERATGLLRDEIDAARRR